MTTLAEKLWGGIAISNPDDCWEWIRGCNQKGYGVLSWQGRRFTTHRLSWELANGEQLGERFACHRCDNRRCCNPSHLYAGDHQTNSDDKFARDRARFNAVRGNRHYNTSLTEADVVEIRAAKGIMPLRVLAEKFSISRSNVCLIQNRKNWAHVGEGI